MRGTDDEHFIPPTWGRIDLTAVLNGTFEPVEPTMFTRDDGQSLIYPGLVHSFHGESESGKSLILQIECARQITSGRNVLYLDFESDPTSVVQRLLDFGVTATDISAHFDYRNPESSHKNFAEHDAWNELLSHTYALAVIDGVTDCLGLFGHSTLDNDDIAAWMRDVPRTLAKRTGAGVALIDHVVKDKESRARFSVGGQQKMNSLTGASYTVEVKEHLGKGCRGVVTLRVGKDRPGAIRPHCGAFRPSDRTQLAATITIDSTGSAIPTVTIAAPKVEQPGQQSVFRPTGLMESISNYIQTNARPSYTNIQTHIGGKKDYVRLALDQLIAEEYVATEKDGQAHRHIHIKPYHEFLDPQSDRYIGEGDGHAA